MERIRTKNPTVFCIVFLAGFIFVSANFAQQSDPAAKTPYATILALSQSLNSAEIRLDARILDIPPRRAGLMLRRHGFVLDRRLEASEKPRGTLIALEQNNRRLSPGETMDPNQKVVLVISTGPESAEPLIASPQDTLIHISDKKPGEIRVGEPSMRGQRILSDVQVGELTMSGQRVQTEVAVNTLSISGLRVQTEVQVNDLKMTGIRVLTEVDVPELRMAGLREE